MNTYNQGYDEYNLGMAALEKKDYQLALVHFRQSLELNPHFKTCQRIAKILQVVGEELEAESYIEKAFELNSSNSQVATGYAELLLKKGFKQKAITILNEVLNKNPNYGPAKRLKLSVTVID